MIALILAAALAAQPAYLAKPSDVERPTEAIEVDPMFVALSAWLVATVLCVAYVKVQQR